MTSTSEISSFRMAPPPAAFYEQEGPMSQSNYAALLKPLCIDRTQPGLPLKKGRCGTMTHDYKRNGTTTLFAALNVLDGKVMGECHGRHRHQEWLKFLRRLDGEFPPGLPLHLVMDNYGTHKEPHVQAWLKKHPRLVCHIVPTRSSWLNLLERWFRELTEKTIRRGSFVSVPDRKSAV